MWSMKPDHAATRVTLPDECKLLSSRGVFRMLGVSLALATSALVSPMLMAAPSVNGNVISWPDDGWYQVQTANDVTSLCNGGSYCDVEPGTYLVINHTTGVRFPDIVVSDEGDPTEATAVINRDNHIDLLTQVFSVYTGRIYGDTLPGIPDDLRRQSD